MSPALSMISNSSGRKGGVRPRVVAIVPSAGSGRRLGLRRRKPFVSLKGKPLVVHTLKALASARSIDSIIIAAERPYLRHFRYLVKKFKIGKVSDIVAGGRTRSRSVANCLRRVNRSFDIVLIHDGARPFVDREMIDGSIRLAWKYGGCIVAVPESDTVKLVGRDLVIKKTLDRKRIYRAQTPQVFRRDLIEKAYTLGKALGGVSDDASLVESLGKRVKILEGTYRNIKITTKEDLKLAEVLL